MKIYVLNGPNLNLLGDREPEIYGSASLEDVEKNCRDAASSFGLGIDFRQTNDEGELIGWLQEARSEAAGVVLNPAAFTHYSLAVRDAVSALTVPVIEVHISNIYAREPWRRKSVVSGVVKGVIAGIGTEGYVLAVEALGRILGSPRD